MLILKNTPVFELGALKSRAGSSDNMLLVIGF